MNINGYTVCFFSVTGRFFGFSTRPVWPQEFGPMILASGGFGADFGSDSLLATYRPDLLHLPTTNGEHCTGRGLSWCAGAATVGIEMMEAEILHHWRRTVNDNYSRGSFLRPNDCFRDVDLAGQAMLSRWERPLELPPSTLNGSRQVEDLHLQSGKTSTSFWCISTQIDKSFWVPSLNALPDTYQQIAHTIPCCRTFLWLRYFYFFRFPRFFFSDFSFEGSSKQASQPASKQATKGGQPASKGGRGKKCKSWFSEVF